MDINPPFSLSVRQCSFLMNISEKFQKKISFQKIPSASDGASRSEKPALFGCMKYEVPLENET